jgi:hypothetical protein
MYLSEVYRKAYWKQKAKHRMPQDEFEECEEKHDQFFSFLR